MDGDMYNEPILRLIYFTTVMIQLILKGFVMNRTLSEGTHHHKLYTLTDCDESFHNTDSD